MSSSDEEDYMSDAFLQKCQDVRPGLLPKNLGKKEDEIHKKAIKSIPKKKFELEQRETGLNTEISSSSKGFLLLQKMGYKPGTGIGKSGEGRKEPVRIEVRSGREGLGTEMARKRKSQELNERRAMMVAKKEKYSEQQTKSFITRMKDRFAEKSFEKDFRIAQTACLQLDQKEGVGRPEQSFFWPSESLPELDSDEDEVVDSADFGTSGKWNEDSDSDGTPDLDLQPELPVTDKLEILTSYLRNAHNYCIWCGTAYDDETQLKTQCPGNSADCHD